MMIKKIKLFIAFLFPILITFLTNNSYALTTYKECKTPDRGGYNNKLLCDNNYFLYYNLKGLHDTVFEIIKKSPTKITNVKDSLSKILNELNNNEYLNKDQVCKGFFNDKICGGDYYDNIKDLSDDEFIKSFKQNDFNISNIINKSKVSNISNEESKIEMYSSIQNTLRNFKSNLSEFTTSLGVLLTNNNKFSFSNVVGGTKDINLRLEALSDPSKSSNQNKNIKHYKIGLIHIFKPFLNLSHDLFWTLPLSGRIIANPYIIFGIIWYYLTYVAITLLIIFIVLSAFLYPLIEVKEGNNMVLKRRNIWLIMMNSSQFNFISYIYTIFLTNNSYNFRYDESKKDVSIKNEYRVPFIVRPIIRNEHVGLGYILAIWLLLFTLLQMLSGYML